MTLQHSEELFTQAELQLQQARAARDAGQYGECEKLAYQATETIAAGYLTKFVKNSVALSENNFQLFVGGFKNLTQRGC